MPVNTGSSIMETSVVAEIADKYDQDSTICGTRREKLVSLRFCEQAHSGGEQQRKHNQNPDSVEGGVTIADRCELIHSDNREYKENEDDKCDDAPNKLFDAGLRIVIETLVICLLAEFFSRK
jgi:hypothetical protein